MYMTENAEKLIADAAYKRAVEVAEFNSMRTCFKCKNWCFDKDKEPDFYCGLSGSDLRGLAGSPQRTDIPLRMGNVGSVCRRT